jgi:hypothetical protein
MRELETQPLDNMAGYRVVKAAYARLFTKVDNSTGTSLSKVSVRLFSCVPHMYNTLKQ